MLNYCTVSSVNHVCMTGHPVWIIAFCIIILHLQISTNFKFSKGTHISCQEMWGLGRVGRYQLGRLFPCKWYRMVTAENNRNKFCFNMAATHLGIQEYNNRSPLFQKKCSYCTLSTCNSEHYLKYLLIYEK